MSTAHGHEEAGRAFAWGVAINFAFVVVEVFFGAKAHSMALLADAGHNLGDVLGLALSWGAALLATRKPSKRRTYGMRKATVLSALANALLLVAATGAVAWESIVRLRAPAHVHGGTVALVALAGVVVNGGSALLFLHGKDHDVNVRSAFVHLAGDAAIALGVAVTGVIVMKTGWSLLDPIVSLAVSCLVFASAVGLLRESTGLIMDAVPNGIDVDRIRTYLCGLAGVVGVHDLHVWPMSTTEVALTAHLVMAAMPSDNLLLRRVGDELHEQFDIEHATIQLEVAHNDPCKLARDDTL